MQLLNTLAVLASATSLAVAQRPMNTSICDYYTTALLKQNTPENQYKLLQLVVNTAVIGNYTQPNVGVKVPGILANGTYMGQQVSLAPYFSGALQSTNRNDKAVSVNFLDGGGAQPLMANQAPAMGSNQARLLSHLYQYFGALLMCSGYSKMGFPAYAGSNSQYDVHKYMNLGPAEVGYFISQVGMSAQSFGVTMDDVKAVGDSLNKAFGYKCSPAAEVIPMSGKMLQSICQADMCPLDPMASCQAYPNNGAVMEPMMTQGGAGAAMNGSSMGGSSMGGSSMGGSSSMGGMSPTGSSAGGMSPSSSSSGPMVTNSNAATANGANVAAIAAAALAFAL